MPLRHKILIFFMCCLFTPDCFGAVVKGVSSSFVYIQPTANPGGADVAIDDISRGGKFTAPHSGTVTEIGWYCGNATQEGNFEVGIYSHNSGTNEPGTLLASNKTNAKGTDAGWKRSAMSYAVTEGTVYWLAVQLDNVATTTNVDYTVLTGDKFDRTAAGSTTLPDPTWGTSNSTFEGTLSTYALLEFTPTLSNDVAFTHELENSFEGGVATFAAAVRISQQKSTFYAAGRYWVFYANYEGTTTFNFDYVTSTDGSTWASPITIGLVYQFDAAWSVHFDGTYVHYARNTATSETNLAYRRGTPETDGTITWSAVEQSIITSGQATNDFSIAVDTDGYPYISHGIYNTTSKVIKSSTNDGTWSMAAGYPLTVRAGALETQIFQLPALKMYIISTVYDGTGASSKAYGYIYDGVSTWTEEADITAIAVEGFGPTAFVPRIGGNSYNGVVYLAYQTDTSNSLKFKSRATDGTWSAEEEFETTNLDVQTSPVVVVDDGDIYVLWSVINDGIYLRKRASGGTWSAAEYIVDDVLEPTYSHLLTDATVQNGGIGFQWLRSNYDIMYGFYELPVAPSGPKKGSVIVT